VTVATHGQVVTVGSSHTTCSNRVTLSHPCPLRGARETGAGHSFPVMGRTDAMAGLERGRAALRRVSSSRSGEGQRSFSRRPRRALTARRRASAPHDPRTSRRTRTRARGEAALR
jgi:hypothetical protein